jgi:regulator of replication initiation timing
MESLYSWMFMLSGATMMALGSLLIVSDRQLRNKRRGPEQLERKVAAKPANPPTESQHVETHSPQESIANNEELTKQISSLSNRLEESQNALSELENEQRRLLRVQSENQQLQEEVSRLRNRFEINETQLRESDSRIQEAVDLGAILRKAIEELKQQLAEKESALEALKNEAQNAAALQSENRHLQDQTAMLRSQLQTNEERLDEAFRERKTIVERHAQLQTRFAELMQQTDELTAKNTQLLKEAEALARKLAASEENAKKISAIEQSARLNNQQLLEAHELGQKESANFRQQLATAQAQLGESAMSNREAAEHNRKLVSEIGELKQQLEAAVNELSTAEQCCSEFQSESQKLRLENQELRQEIDRHRIQLNANESRSQESAQRSQELAERCARLETDAADYRQQLEDSQSKRREIDGAQERLANAESREIIYRDQQRKLEGRLVDLQRELSEEKNKVRALEDTQERLRETERELREEAQRLGEERARWQERFAARKDNQRPVGSADQPAERSIVVSQPIGGSMGLVSEAADAEAIRDATALSLEPLSSSSIETIGDQDVIGPGDSPVGVAVAGEEPASSRIWTWGKPKWRYGALPAIGVVVIALAMAFLGSTFLTSKESADAPGRYSDEFSADDDVAKPQTKAAPRLPGTYETIRTTQVYTGPSENSALIGSIGPKTKLNVINVNKGWLEIRSRHGRPPGFIRQEAAVRIGQK